VKARTLLVKVALLAGAAGAALAGTAAAASAAPLPAPHSGHAGPEFFTIVENSTYQNGLVNAYGPVAGYNGTLGSNNAGTVAYLQFRHGTVDVAHPVTPDPEVNLRACTATVYQTGHWTITGGTHAYRGARGAGQFQLYEVSKFARVHGHCQAGNPAANPVSFQLSVDAEGYASLR